MEMAPENIANDKVERSLRKILRFSRKSVEKRCL